MMNQSYFNHNAEKWDAQRTEKDVRKLEDLSLNLAIPPGATVLDVGTGTGVFIPFLLAKIGPRGKLVCLDAAERMLEKARQKNFPGNIEYVCGDIADTGLDRAIFDAVVCYASFPHFRNKPAALREINRVLKKGGWLFICHTSGRMFLNRMHGRVPELSHDLIPEREEMVQMLGAAGFGEINIRDETDYYLALAVKLYQ
jgi:ubiquinone/menaquinone biosynthesis C-methylase UbiE